MCIGDIRLFQYVNILVKFCIWILFGLHLALLVFQLQSTKFATISWFNA